ncbi:MAG: NPCBM/NEW2 domain-containing protein, partial [Planctomycetaceae bacterium]
SIVFALPGASTAQPALIQMHLTCGTRIRVPRSALKSIAVLGGRAVYLSDLKPVAYRFRPFLSQDWPLRHDRNVVGGPLRLRGREYAKGLGTHSRSEISFALDRKYDRFSTVIGIDDCSAGGGQAVFSVFVDGQRVYHSGMVSGNDAPREVPAIDVSSSNRLTLSVDYGAGGDVLDRADWCQAMLIRKTQPPR